MKEMLKFVDFLLKGIKTEQFAIIEENYKPKSKIELITNSQFLCEPSLHQLGVIIGFDFKQGKNIFLKIQVSCHFQIEENSWNNLLNESEQEVLVPKAVIAHLAMLTISTARGVLFAKTENTRFAQFIIPIINIESIVNEDVIFKSSVNYGVTI